MGCASHKCVYANLFCGIQYYMQRKKSKYRHVTINKKKYYFYKISWLHITADGGHATADEFDQFECSKMVTFGYLYKRTKKFIWTFASYDQKDEAYSDRNIFPTGVITGMEKLNVESRQNYCGLSGDGVVGVALFSLDEFVLDVDVFSFNSAGCLSGVLLASFLVSGVTFKIGA